MSTTFSEVKEANPDATPNQALFIYHLRQNPHGVRQITSRLDDDHGGMCALGLGMEAFNIIRTSEQWRAAHPEEADIYYNGFNSYDPYGEIAKVLDVPIEHVNQIYYLNDDDYLSFGQIADVFEKYLKTDRKRGPRDLHRLEKNKDSHDEFVAKWETAKKNLEILTAKRDALEDDIESQLEVARAIVDDHYLYEDDVTSMTGEEAWEQYKDDED